MPVTIPDGFWIEQVDSEALPVVSVEFRPASGSPGVVLDRDTGADASVLPWADCQLLQLTPALGVQGLISGVAGNFAATLAFLIWAWRPEATGGVPGEARSCLGLCDKRPWAA